LITTFLTDDEKIYESVNRDGKIQYACWDGQQLTYHDNIELGEETYQPSAPDINHLVTGGTLILPSDACEYQDKAELLREIQSFIHMYLDISPKHEQLCSIYVLSTWLYDNKDTVCYLRFIGDTGTGKSRALKVVGNLCYKTINMAGALTPAPIFRVIDKYHGTLIVDEADWKQSSEQSEITKILNGGFEKNMPVWRCSPDNPEDVQTFNTFCPKVLATRREFHDPALESRCITITMEETGRTDIPVQLKATFYEEQSALRNKLLMFRFKNYSIEPTEVEVKVSSCRLKQGFYPLAQVISDMPQLLEEFNNHITGYEDELREKKADSWEGQIVNAISQLHSSGKTEITPTEIAHRVDAISGYSGKYSMTPSRVGRMLRTLKFTTEQRKVKGETKRILIINEEHFAKLKNRYIPQIAMDATSITSTTSTTNTALEELMLNIKNSTEHEEDLF